MEWIKIASAPNEMQAMMMQGLLRESDIPVLIQRSTGFDAPEFLAGGPPMSELILRGEIPTGSKVTIVPNDISNDDVAEDESIVDIEVSQPKEIVKAEQ